MSLRVAGVISWCRSGGQFSLSPDSAGSEGFVNWIDNTLAIRSTANVLWTGEEQFDFRVLNTVEELEAAMRSRVEAGAAARLVAGYCWPWSKPDLAGHRLP